MSKNEIVRCAICGVNEATTMDHVPPKNIFIPPRPQNMITVPSCSKCNHGASGADEIFKAYLTTHIQSVKMLYGNNNTDLLDKLLTPTLNNNRRLAISMLKAARPKSAHTASGVYIEDGFALSLPNEGFKVLERIVRGLYYKHTRNVLGLDINCKIIMENRPDKWESVIHGTHRYSVGSSDEFIYRYGLYNQNPKISFWFLFFYTSCMFVVSTGAEQCEHP